MPKTKKRSDGYYAVHISLGHDAAGKRKTKTFYGKTQREAQKKADAFRAAIGLGMDAARAGTTFGALAAQYIETKRAQGVGASWLRSLQDHVNHLAPLHNLPAEQIRSPDIQAVLNGLGAWHDCKPPLSHKTLSQIRGTARAIFERAIPEVVQYNPCNKVVVPAGTPSKQRTWLTAQQQRWVQEMPHRAQRAAMVMMYSGLRRGELSALTWADVDLDARTIRVNKAVDSKTGEIKAPKTAAGIRTVDIPTLLADYLRAESAAEVPRCLYVIHKKDGSRMTESAWKSLWDSYMLDLNVRYGYKDANKYASRRKSADGKEQSTLPMRIQPFTAHQLRHTFATIMYLAGVDVLTASKQLGHATPQITMAIYTHLDDVYKRRNMDKLDTWLADKAQV